MTAEFDADLTVLEHLRGYPQDLQRYANLMKQAHPRGRSAVALLLSRPAPEGFVETICRYVRDGVAIVTAVGAAEAAGLPPREFLERLAARADFPAPLFRQDHRAVWRKAEVDAYLRRWKEAAPS